MIDWFAIPVIVALVGVAGSAAPAVGRQVEPAPCIPAIDLWQPLAADSGTPLCEAFAWLTVAVPAAVVTLAFDPAGDTLAAALDDGRGWLLHADGRREPIACGQGLFAPLDLSFAPDGRILAWPDGTSALALLDGEDGALRRTRTWARHPILDAAYDPQGRFLATLSTHGIALWRDDGSLPRGETLLEARSGATPAQVVCAADGASLTVLELPDRPGGPASRLTHLTILVDGRVLGRTAQLELDTAPTGIGPESGGCEVPVLLERGLACWSPGDEEPWEVLFQGGDWHTMTISRRGLQVGAKDFEGRIAVLSSDGREIATWTAPRAQPRPRSGLTGDAGAAASGSSSPSWRVVVTSMAFSWDGTVLATGMADGSILLWRVPAMVESQ